MMIILQLFGRFIAGLLKGLVKAAANNEIVFNKFSSVHWYNSASENNYCLSSEMSTSDNQVFRSVAQKCNTAIHVA